MKRIPLQISDEYTAALSRRLGFDLSPQNLVTRSGKAYIAEKAALVSRISEGLTKSRHTFLASDYLKDKKISEAYLLYYMTTNLLKVIQPLRELACSNFFEGESLKVLDLGTGTGAAVCGILGYLHEEKKNILLDMTLSDFLEENLGEAKIFLSDYIGLMALMRPILSFSKFDLQKPHEIPGKIKSEAPYHLITMMNVLNELDEKQDSFLLGMLVSLLDEHGAIILIEPATRLESRRLLRFRDMAVTNGITIFSPCTRQEGCPSLINGDDWCHTEVDWKRPAFIEAIDDLTGNLRLSLKSTYIILRKDGITLGNSLRQNNLYRVVSKRFDEKGRVRAFLCGTDGRDEYILNKRDLSDANKDFSEIERYDVVRVNEAQNREHDKRITKLSPISTVLHNLGAR
jgi:ribosomal protein RSM22 (predicted rRNA methylase)